MIVTGHGHVILAPGDTCDPSPYLKAPKLRKYMGVQDDLAVSAAARALESREAATRSGASDESRVSLRVAVSPERIGLYLAVGFIPFEQADLDPLLTASLDDGRFSMDRFSTAGFRAVNGLLTFRCLPNMPAFHVSVNCNIQGPYFVTYPGPGQFYLALEEAVTALRAGTIDVALVVGVAHQRNFLVEYHFGRIDDPVPAEQLRDAAGCIVLERAHLLGPALARLARFEVAYRAHDPFAQTDCEFRENFRGFNREVCGYLGAAALPARLSFELASSRGRFEHVLHSRDGYIGQSTWEGM